MGSSREAHAPARRAAQLATKNFTEAGLPFGTIFPFIMGTNPPACLQSIPETSWGPAFSLGASFPHDQPPLPPPLLRGAQQALPLAPSGLTAAGGLSQAMAALDGACMSEGPFSLMVPPEVLPLEGGPVAEGGDRACVVEAAAADVAVALEALGCNAPRGTLRQAGEHERELMPPPPPRQMVARQLAPAGLSREQLAAAVLAATEAGRAAPGSDACMTDCRLAAAAPAAAGTGPAAGHTPTVQMHQVRHGGGISVEQCLQSTSASLAAQVRAPSPCLRLHAHAGGRRSRQPQRQSHAPTAHTLPQAPVRGISWGASCSRVWQPV